MLPNSENLKKNPIVPLEVNITPISRKTLSSFHCLYLPFYSPIWQSQGRLGLKNRQVGEKWVFDDCSYLCKGLYLYGMIKPNEDHCTLGSNFNHLYKSHQYRSHYNRNQGINKPIRKHCTHCRRYQKARRLQRFICIDW
jgi:hypothetical protein